MQRARRPLPWPVLLAKQVSPECLQASGTTGPTEGNEPELGMVHTTTRPPPAGVPLQACRQGCEGSGQADTLSVAVPAPQPRSSYGRGHLANRARNTPYLLAPGQQLPCRDKHRPRDSTEGLSLSLWRSGWAEPHPVTGAPRLEQLGVSAANGSFLLSKTAFSPQRQHL